MRRKDMVRDMVRDGSGGTDGGGATTTSAQREYKHPRERNREL